MVCWIVCDSMRMLLVLMLNVLVLLVIVVCFNVFSVFCLCSNCSCVLWLKIVGISGLVRYCESVVFIVGLIMLVSCRIVIVILGWCWFSVCM